MTIDLARRTQMLVLMIGLLAGPGLFASSAAAQGAPAVAVVDVDRLFDDSAVATAIREQMQSVLGQAEGQLNQLRRELQDIETQLQQLAPDSERALALQRERAIKQSQLQAETQFGQARLTLIRLQGNLQVLTLIKQAVGEVAQQKGIGIVLRKAPPLPPSLRNQRAEEVQNRMQQQIAIYAAPEFDITSDVLIRMDELYRSGATGAPSATQSGQQNQGNPAGGQ